MDENVRQHIEQKKKERELEIEMAHMRGTNVDRASLVRYAVNQIKEIYGYDDEAAAVYAKRFLPESVEE